MSVDVLNDDGMGYTSDIVAGIDWVLQHKDQYGIRVVNLSLTGSDNSSFMYDPLDRAVERLWFGGIVVVAAVGNYGIGSEQTVTSSPGNDPFVISVGAADLNGTPGASDDFAAPWSVYGYTYDGFRKPEISAPGRNLVAAVPMTATLAVERRVRRRADEDGAAENPPAKSILVVSIPESMTAIVGVCAVSGLSRVGQSCAFCEATGQSWSEEKRGVAGGGGSDSRPDAPIGMSGVITSPGVSASFATRFAFITATVPLTSARRLPSLSPSWLPPVATIAACAFVGESPCTITLTYAFGVCSAFASSDGSI